MQEKENEKRNKTIEINYKLPEVQMELELRQELIRALIKIADHRMETVDGGRQMHSNPIAIHRIVKWDQGGGTSTRDPMAFITVISIPRCRRWLLLRTPILNRLLKERQETRYQADT